MAKLLKAGEAVPFRPAGDAGPCYLLRVPDVYEKAALDRAVAARGAININEPDVLRLAIDAVREILAGDDDAAQRDELVGLLEAEIARFDADYVDALLNPTPQVAELRGVLRRAGAEAFNQAVADQLNYWTVLGIEAVRLFVVGRDETTFKRTSRGIDEAAIAKVPAEHRRAIAFEVLRLSAPTGDEEKNSDSPSLTTGSGSNSTAMSAPPPDAP